MGAIGNGPPPRCLRGAPALLGVGRLVGDVRARDKLGDEVVMLARDELEM
jgi:hypothetical protein